MDRTARVKTAAKSNFPWSMACSSDFCGFTRHARATNRRASSERGRSQLAKADPRDAMPSDRSSRSVRPERKARRGRSLILLVDNAAANLTRNPS